MNNKDCHEKHQKDKNERNQMKFKDALMDMNALKKRYYQRKLMERSLTG